MRVWIDADACPKAAKDQVVKFALKRQLEVVLVAGQSQIKPAFACVRLIVVPSGRMLPTITSSNMRSPASW